MPTVQIREEVRRFGKKRLAKLLGANSPRWKALASRDDFIEKNRFTKPNIDPHKGLDNLEW